MADERINIVNRRARFEYEILDTYEAGIVLEGSEVKSVRAGKVSIAEAYCKFVDSELFLVDCHVTPYAQAGTHTAVSPTRMRKLLLKRVELRKLRDKVTTKGLTIVPLRIYLHDRLVKVEIALARGKKLADKRKTIRDRDLQREARGLKGKLRV